jgi:hypothetical protein
MGINFKLRTTGTLNLGMRHVYIKPRALSLNGKIELSHSTDQQGFYQLITYINDMDLHAELKEWQNFYSLH